MSDFKKGDRVRSTFGRYATAVSDVYLSGHETEMIDVQFDQDGTLVGGKVIGKLLSNLTKIVEANALPFGDVKTGDKITVEADGVTISGSAKCGVHSVFIGELPIRLNEMSGVWWLDAGWGPAATLTAHEPAEPEWHRAKVIKADYGEYKGEFWVGYCDGEWVSSRYQASTDELTNVVIIVGADGNVVSR